MHSTNTTCPDTLTHMGQQQQKRPSWGKQAPEAHPQQKLQDGQGARRE